MTIKEMEDRTGVPRANLRYYEQEGLLKPNRLKNGYRDYSERDVEELMRIKLLRSLDVSTEDIKKLQSGEESLSGVLTEKIHDLRDEREKAAYAEKVCRAICDETSSYSSLDGQKYLTYIPQEEHAPARAYLADDRPSLYPVRRYFARALDMLLYTAVWWLILCAMGTNIINMPAVVPTILDLIVMIIVEPLLIWRFGTTPGKKLLGVRLESEDGGNPSYIESLIRTGSVILHGFGLFIPLVSLYCIGKSFSKTRKGETLAWERPPYPVMIYDNLSLRRKLPFAVSSCLCLLIMLTAYSGSRLPPNRGDLTVEQYAENFNYVTNYNFGQYYGYGESAEAMRHDGTWDGGERFPFVTLEGQWGLEHDFISNPEGVEPEFHFTEENGALRAVGFSVGCGEVDGWIGTNVNLVHVVTQAFITSDRGVNAVSLIPYEMMEKINSYDHFSPYEFELDGFTVRFDIEYSGYHKVGNFAVAADEENGAEKYYRCEFTIEKTG